MNDLTIIGKKRTLLISISILLVSLHTIYFYHVIRPELESKKLIQQIIRFILTTVLLLGAYKGKKWAKLLSIILFSIAIIGAFTTIIKLETSSFINKIPIIVMILVYAMAVYHFAISKSYKAFFDFQNSNNDEKGKDNL